MSDTEYEFYENMYKKPKKEPEEKNAGAKMELYDWLQCIVAAVICGILIFVFIGRAIGVDGYSMLPTLHNNDRVLTMGLFYTPKNGDIVIIKTKEFGDIPLVKRVIATAGQTLDINFQTHQVFVDGVEQYEPYINAPTSTMLDFSGPVTVPDGYVFVMGDNRNKSRDSRDKSIGMIDTRNILGRVFFIIIPGSDEDNPRDWTRAGTVS